MPKPALQQTFKPHEPMTAADRAYNARNNQANQQQWVDELIKSQLADPQAFSEFEHRYIAQMYMLLKQGTLLTDPQALRLEQIYADNTD